MTCELRLRGALRQRAAGRPVHDVEGATLADAVGDLLREHPDLAGWILDERGAVRRHINLYVNGEPAGLDAAVGEGDTIDVLPAISGGAR
jgi:sulfur-carrier protein